MSERVYSEFYFKASLNFSCNFRFRSRGSPSVLCQPSGEFFEPTYTYQPTSSLVSTPTRPLHTSPPATLSTRQWPTHSPLAPRRVGYDGGDWWKQRGICRAFFVYFLLTGVSKRSLISSSSQSVINCGGQMTCEIESLRRSWCHLDREICSFGIILSFSHSFSFSHPSPLFYSPPPPSLTLSHSLSHTHTLSLCDVFMLRYQMVKKFQTVVPIAS